MTSISANNDYYLPKNFVRILVGSWVFFTIFFGIFSDWLFLQLMNDKEMVGEGIFYTAIYTSLLIGIFGITWIPLNRKFPLEKPGNLRFHGLVQIANTLIGFFIGFMITAFIHIKMYGLDYIPKGNPNVAWAVLAMMCLIGMLIITGIFYNMAYLKRSTEAEKRLTESELSALRAQINPHFLFNSLNSIAALIRLSPQKAESVTEDLADVFRYTLQASQHPLVLLKEELEIVRLYLNIEKARFSDRLSIEINVPDALLLTPIPVLTLQPLLENAIKHGVSKKEGNHLVRLSVTQVSNLIQITVADTGPGFQAASFKELLHTGTGLSNVFQRLKLQFGEKVDGAVSGHEISLRFPIQNTEPPHLAPALP